MADKWLWEKQKPMTRSSALVSGASGGGALDHSVGVLHVRVISALCVHASRSVGTSLQMNSWWGPGF